jgi:6-phosphofructokinase 1
MNAAVRAATRAALARGWEVLGVSDGFSGLIAGDMRVLGARDVGGIIQRGGSMLGCARCPEFRTLEGRQLALANLARRGAEALVVIGGNGSQSGSQALAQMGFSVVGVASTIDNDLAGTEDTIGVDTAVNVTLEAIDRLRTTAASHRRAFLVETMGRQCGHIALMAGVAGGAEVIAVPEMEVAPAEVAERLMGAYRRGKTHALGVVAEGARHGTAAVVRYFAEHRDRIGFDLRVTTLGHVVRGGVPTAVDRILATRLGAAAIERIAAGEDGVMMGVRRGLVVSTPLAEVAGRSRPIDVSLLELARALAQ